MTVWPFLLAGAAVCSYWNWKAALFFALAVGVGQATTRLGLSQEHLLAGYSLLAVVALFFFDVYAGAVLAAFGLVIGAHIFGFMGHMPKVITGEFLLVAGMLVCGLNGPSGGLFDGRPAPSDGGLDTADLGGPAPLPRASSIDKAD